MPRTPRQKRAQATVDAIIEAGFISLARHGSAGTTTRHVAEIAGLGVGSVYEYFANKEEIYAAMNRRFVDDIVGLMRDLMPRLTALPIADAVRLLLGTLEAFLRRHDERYLKYARAMVTQREKLNFGPVENILQQIAISYVMANPAIVRIGRLQVMSYIFIQGGIFTVLSHLSNPNPPFSYAELTEGLARMVSHYVAQELAQEETLQRR